MGSGADPQIWGPRELMPSFTGAYRGEVHKKQTLKKVHTKTNIVYFNNYFKIHSKKLNVIILNLLLAHYSTIVKFK